MKTFQYQIIRKVLVVLPFYLFTFLPLSAQSFTERIQKPVTGQGTVTIHQDDAIDQLVNSATLATRPAPTTPAAKPASPTATTDNPDSPADARKKVVPNSIESENPDEAAPVDNRKKIMRNSYKVSGFRVQVYAGYNREGKQKAEQAGNNVKASFPNVPVYVHYNQPRWICRVGNYRTSEEAHQMLLNLRKLGFTQASVVKDRISVQY